MVPQWQQGHILGLKSNATILQPTSPQLSKDAKSIPEHAKEEPMKDQSLNENFTRHRNSGGIKKVFISINEESKVKFTFETKSFP